MKVTVDTTICEANALCAGLVPEVFDVDDEDELHILPRYGEVPSDLENAVREAVRSCPRMALSLQELGRSARRGRSEGSGRGGFGDGDRDRGDHARVGRPG
ncbi:MAG TPA: ferredoxin [Trebonia sp.]|jgi:ferredoxin|nr:ferredoxin [Trebonia sp.]